MKRIFIFILIVLFSTQIFGQTTEYSVQLTSGFFSFRGRNAATSTYYITNDFSTLKGAADNPYGRLSGFSYGFALQAQRVTKWHFIYGLQAGYESLSSKARIDDIATFLMGPYLNISISRDSKAILTNQFIIFHPFAGSRLNIIKGIKTDFTFGADFGFCTSSEETDIVHTDKGNADMKSKLAKPKVDSRLRVDFINYYKRIGLTIGYSYGLTNYEAKMIPGGKVYSQMFRLGLVFKL